MSDSEDAMTGPMVGFRPQTYHSDDDSEDENDEEENSDQEESFKEKLAKERNLAIFGARSGEGSDNDDSALVSKKRSFGKAFSGSEQSSDSDSPQTAAVKNNKKVKLFLEKKQLSKQKQTVAPAILQEPAPQEEPELPALPNLLHKTPAPVTQARTISYDEQNRRDAAAQEVRTLGQIFDENDEEELNIVRLERLMGEIEYLWKFDSHKYPQETIMKLICDNVGIDGTRLNEVTLKQVLDVFESRLHVNATSHLQNRFNLLALLDPSSPKCQEYTQRFQKLYDIQHSAMHYLYNWLRMNFCIQNEQNIDSSKEIGLIRFQASFNAEASKGLNELTSWLLQDLSAKQYRKKGIYVYEKVESRIGGKTYFTHAWKQKCTIKQYVSRVVDPNTSAHIFALLPSYAGVAINFLTFVECIYFPVVEESDFYLSFKNGVYFLPKDIFYPYDTTLPITSSERGAVERKTVATLMEPGDEFYQNLTSDIVSFNYIDEVFIHRYSEVDLMKIKTPIDTIWKGQKLGMDEGGIHDMPDTDEELEKKRQPNVQWWCWVLLGRGLYRSSVLGKTQTLKNKKTGEMFTREIKEKWETNLNLIGYAGTGKSTALSPFNLIFPIDQIGVISNNIEHKWALSTMVTPDQKCKRICIGPDLKKNFQWDQAEFQQCVSVEKVLVATKNITAYAIDFNAPIFFGMNEFFVNWKDASESLKRRMVFIYFDQFISNDQKNVGIKEEIRRSIGDIVQKLNRAYIEGVSLFGDRYLWKVLPKYFENTSNQCIEAMNPLLRFLQSPDYITRNIEATISFDEFKKGYKYWYEREVGPVRGINWTKEFYGSTFDSQHLTVKAEITGNSSKDMIRGLSFNSEFLDSIRKHQSGAKQ